MVGDVRFAGEWDRNDLDRLIVVKRLKDALVEIFDVYGSAAGRFVGGGLSGMFGQGVSWRTRAPSNVFAAQAKGFGDTSGGLAHEWRLRTSGRAAGEGK
jgi:hypothetical protein